MKQTAQTNTKQKNKDALVTNAVGAYLDALHKFPQLKHPELVDLFKIYVAGRTKIEDEEEDDKYDLTPEAAKARKKIAECNLRLVVSIAKQYHSHNLPIEDLIQEGNLGLLKAITRYKWEKGFRFSTYATWWIKQAIGQHVLKRKRIIRLPAHAASVQRKMLQAAEEFRDEHCGAEPTLEELTTLIGASSAVMKATMRSGRATISLQQPCTFEKDGDTLEDRIEDDRSGSDPFTNCSEKELVEIVRNVLASLSPKEAAILRLRFGLVEEVDPTDFPITDEEEQQIMSGKGLT